MAQKPIWMRGSIPREKIVSWLAEDECTPQDRVQRYTKARKAQERHRGWWRSHGWRNGKKFIQRQLQGRNVEPGPSLSFQASTTKHWASNEVLWDEGSLCIEAVHINVFGKGWNIWENCSYEGRLQEIKPISLPLFYRTGIRGVLNVVPQSQVWMPSMFEANAKWLQDDAYKRGISGRH